MDSADMIHSLFSEYNTKKAKIALWRESKCVVNDETNAAISRPESIIYWEDIYCDSDFQRIVFYNGTDNDRDMLKEMIKDKYEWDSDMVMMFPKTYDDFEELYAEDEMGDDKYKAAEKQFDDAVNHARKAGLIVPAEE